MTVCIFHCFLLANIFFRAGAAGSAICSWLVSARFSIKNEKGGFMKKYLLGCLAFASFACSGQDVMSCAAVYSNAVRDVQLYTRQSSEKYFIFNQHCEQSGETKSSSTSLDLTIPIKTVVIGFSGDQANAQSEMKNFCKTFASNLATASSSVEYKNTAVVDALSNFNDCRRLETEGVKFIQSIERPNGLSITAQFNPDKTKLTITDISTVGLSCRTGGASPGGKIVTTASIKQAFNPKGAFSVSCARIGKKSATGTSYGRASLRLDTNWGPYSVTLQPDGLQDFDIASVAKELNDSLERSNKELTATLLTERARADNYQGRWNNVSVDTYATHLGEGAPLPCRSDPTAWAKNVCGARPMILTNAGSRGGNECGYTFFVASCISK